MNVLDRDIKEKREELAKLETALEKPGLSVMARAQIKATHTLIENNLGLLLAMRQTDGD